LFDVPLPCQTETPENNDDNSDIAEIVYLDNSQYLDAARTLYEKLMSGDVCAEEACS